MLVQFAPVIAVVLGVSFAVPASAAHPFSQEEYERKVEEIGGLVERGLLDAAEGKFEAVSVNEDYELTPDLFLLGARMARSVGDVALVKQRLASAVELGADVEVAGWLSQLDEEYGSVHIASKKKDFRVLVPDPPPFSPDHTIAVTHATSVFAETGEFSGYLPAGTYLIAGNPVEVKPGEECLDVVLSKKGALK